MLTGYILYKKTTPFPGYLMEWGAVDFDKPHDGSTVAERIQAMLDADEDLSLYVAKNMTYLSGDIQESMKFDATLEILVKQEPGNITPLKQVELNAGLQRKAIDDNMPSWNQVEAMVENISSLLEAKAFLVKLARVVYWLAKNQSD